MTERERERQRKSDRERQTERDRDTQRDRDRQTDKETQTDRHTDRENVAHVHKHLSQLCKMRGACCCKRGGQLGVLAVPLSSSGR